MLAGVCTDTLGSQGGKKRDSGKKVSIDLDWIRSIFAEIRHEQYTFENDQKPVYDLVHGEGIILEDT